MFLLYQFLTKFAKLRVEWEMGILFDDAFLPSFMISFRNSRTPCSKSTFDFRSSEACLIRHRS